MSKFSAVLIILFAIAFEPVQAQFSHQDSLRGTLSTERTWWNLLHYDLAVAVDTASKSISGSNTITFEVVSAPQEMQIDLQAPMKITRVESAGEELAVRDDGNAHFIQVKKNLSIGSEQKITIYYEGVPRVAAHAPWDGGFTWTHDSKGKAFIATSNQGIGASLWWPCKDHPADEPDRGITMSYTVPSNLVAVGNGRLIKTKKGKGVKTYTWQVVNPINDYGVNLNIGDYVSFGLEYAGAKGKLDMTYYVLSSDLDKAKKQFKDAERMMQAFEYWFGPYPFYEDGYKLVEVPYLGMEHQSSVTYGNGFENGYLGRDLSLSGYGLLWDYIITHESGHEWFANNITYQDMADMWIHESFTCYSEGLFTEYYYGKEAGAAYIRGMRYGIYNESPVIGPYGVNQGGEDLYNKGSNILHTLRQWIGDDEKWRQILHGLNERFYHQTVTTLQIEQYIADQSGLDLKAFFDQYLRDVRVPVLEYMVTNGQLLYRWTNTIENFDMPVKIKVGNTEHIITPDTRWNFRDAQRITVKEGETITVNPDYYIYSSLITGATY